ncbi:MlaC/ttg2D family ABC transporter substrate-binding protein [Thiohalomonas denitrificans]|uniref:Phospholipid transport system substrate-binding protein n=1 Tax=Thiohalomonas denitrificans TaxID=415747 RepID=A0A1G5QUU1_9GAMM|nr:ABC transporter substrate-binding protein [Thiohalomonas denitrificans]SCZ65001.1 phospholipid transport system substrate-binding protein [Thiohalomonas denitrificans]
MVEDSINIAEPGFYHPGSKRIGTTNGLYQEDFTLLRHSPFPSRLFVTALLALVFALPATAGETPQEMLRAVTEEMVTRLQNEKDALQERPERLFTLVEDTLVPYVDQEAMSRLVLGVAWRRATPEQRERFTKEFKTLLVRFYTSALLDNPDQIDRLLEKGQDLITFRPGGEARGNRIQVRAEAHPPEGPSVPVIFSLYQKEGQWLIYDVKVEGVSIVVNYRNSFSSQVKQFGLSEVINRLAKRNQELWEKTVENGQS